MAPEAGGGADRSVQTAHAGGKASTVQKKKNWEAPDGHTPKRSSPRGTEKPKRATTDPARCHQRESGILRTAPTRLRAANQGDVDLRTSV